MRKPKTFWGQTLRGLVMPLVVLAVLLYFATALSGLTNGQADQQRRQLEEALRRSCVACYAAEGVYPPNLDYLRSRYGVQVDEERYTVHYEVFASNLMPTITILEKK